jgi:hypothetical protein
MNVDERTANLTLLRSLNRVPIERKNLGENIVLAHVNRSRLSRVLGDGTQTFGALEVTGDLDG